MTATFSCAVILCNLGTPDEPTPQAVKRYLAEFLSDPRVVELPAWIWKPILHGVVLPMRSAKSAHKYASIWKSEGSPLKVWSSAQAKALESKLAPLGVKVHLAMRYGNPNIGTVLNKVTAAGISRVILLSGYPQYSGTTTASLVDAVHHWSQKQRVIPELNWVFRYGTDTGYIEALAQKVEASWQTHGRAAHLVMSFHGIPERCAQLGDPYPQECKATADALAQRLGLGSQDYSLTFQSRFGAARWLSPYTQDRLVLLAKQGVPSIEVICPGFIADCLETLEEINLEARAAFLAAGGKEFRYIECLNDSPAFIESLAALLYPFHLKIPI